MGKIVDDDLQFRGKIHDYEKPDANSNGREGPDSVCKESSKLHLL